jgi:hypothetical protein
MNLQSMKMSAAEAEKYASTAIAEDRREYPWGLTLSLEGEQMAKLLGAAPPAVGTVMVMQARVRVTRASQHQSKNKKVETCCNLQITDMALEPETPARPAAETIYGA